MARPYDLSSITALICFEAAARNLSFKKAAQELNVTPAAISHQIKALEADLGCVLFMRQNKGVELTEKGAFLFVALQRGFESISETVSQLRERPETVDVTVRSTTAVSSLWLTPKISAFWKNHPTVTIAQIVSDVASHTSRCDLSIHYGIPDEGSECCSLFRDRIVALGTPRFAEQYRISTIADLVSAPLVHSSGEETNWTKWSDWFSSLGQPAPKGRNFYVNNYMIALQTAQDDLGAVLGWDGLVKSLLHEGRFVQLVPDCITSPMPFYLKIHPRASAKARIFAEWIVGNV
ncbi:LysR family transcriptional regulator [Brucella cytisi]|uniref:LysR family transcriptional regulator n=1 Tax=Brucella cytisi TaxID=407152 RepID=UPI0035D9D13F